MTECGLLRERSYMETCFHNFSVENFMIEESFTTSGLKIWLIMFISSPELHATWRTKEHRCSPGRIFSNPDTKNMQVPPSPEGSLYIYFVATFSLYLHVLLMIFFKRIFSKIIWHSKERADCSYWWGNGCFVTNLYME